MLGLLLTINVKELKIRSTSQRLRKHEALFGLDAVSDEILKSKTCKGNPIKDLYRSKSPTLAH